MVLLITNHRSPLKKNKVTTFIISPNKTTLLDLILSLKLLSSNFPIQNYIDTNLLFDNLNLIVKKAN